MILADSAIWIDHLRAPNLIFAEALQRQRILCHPLVIGEVAMGSLKDRAAILRSLSKLDQADVARNEEVLRLVEERRLFSRGLGFIDAHLLASALLTPSCKLWTRDRRLEKAAAELGVAATPTH
ncbi:MAG: type II toxin-antitoxin system VapC family toxin [Pseudomonadota bacterium]